MARLVFNRDGGSADQYGHLLALNRMLFGEVIEGLAVAQNSPLGMSVLVGAGTGRIPTGTSPTNYGFFVGIDTGAGEAVTITTANGSNPRIDVIVAYVDLSVTPSLASANNPNNMLKLAAVAGTPASTPAAPNGSAIQSAIGASNPYITLAQVLVGTAVTQVTNSDITDYRIFAVTRNSRLAIATRSTPQGSITTETDLTAMSLTINTPGGIDIRLSANLNFSSSSANTQNLFSFKEGSTLLRTIAFSLPNTSNAFTKSGSVIITPAAGRHTYKITASASGGGTLQNYGDGSTGYTNEFVAEVV